MTITKYEHACLVIEEQGKRLVIDPGDASPSFNDFQNVTAVVVTHIHSDHLGADKIKKIIEQSPGVVIFTTEEGTKEIGSHAQAVTANMSYEAGPFRLKFYGGQHALIHQSIPQIQNFGVLVNNRFYYPGDSFVVPDTPVEILAVPAGAPWMKFGEAMDFAAAVKPRVVFLTHTAVLSDFGLSIANHLIGFIDSFGAEYRPLASGESLEAD